MHDAKHLQKKKSFFISSKWRLVWHLSKLETLTVRVQRYLMKCDLEIFSCGAFRGVSYLCTRTAKVSNFDKCQTRRHFEEIQKDFFFVNASHHASNRHLSQVIAKKVIIAKNGQKLLFTKTLVIAIFFAITFQFICNNFSDFLQ